MLRGFKSFLMRGGIIVIAVGLAVSLAFSTLIKAFTDSIITPLVNAAGERQARAWAGRSMASGSIWALSSLR
jgi:large-conductance mechanosensitive channel